MKEKNVNHDALMSVQCVHTMTQSTMCSKIYAQQRTQAINTEKNTQIKARLIE